MRKVILYIAMSLDGFIASKDGKVDWLHGQNVDEENIDTYSSFIKDVNADAAPKSHAPSSNLFPGIRPAL